MFLGMQFFSDDWCVSQVATSSDPISKLEITNGVYDDLFGTTKTDILLENSYKVWDFYTKFYAKFQDNLMAGNVNYSAKTVSKVRIKRRKANEFDWFTIYELPIEKNEDFNFELIDRYAQGDQLYNYALIPMSNNIEGNINSNIVQSEFYAYYILDKNCSYPIMLNTSLSLTLNKESSTVSTLGRKYPFYISNGMSQYKSGTLSFGLVPFTDCQPDTKAGYNYRQQFEEWINDGNPKIIKDWTGQIFMINITSAIPINYETYEMPQYEISFTEIGSVTDWQDMYNNGFTDVSFYS